MSTIEKLAEAVARRRNRLDYVDPTPWDIGAGDEHAWSLAHDRASEERELAGRLVAAAAAAREPSLTGAPTGYELSAHELQVLDRVLRRGAK